MSLHRALRVVFLWVTATTVYASAFVGASSNGVAATFEVADQNAFETALERMVGGDQINLVGSGRFKIIVRSKNFSPPIIIKSSKEPSEPEVNYIEVRNSSGIVLDNIRLLSSPGENKKKFLLVILFSARIEITNFKATGSAQDFLTQNNKLQATGESFAQIGRSDHIRLLNNQVSNFNHGVNVGKSSNVQLMNNDISQLQGDGIQLVSVRNIAIIGNRLHDFIGSETSVNHNDMIQLWSTNAEVVSSDITIARNRLLEGDGPNIKGIFMRNEQVDLSEGGSQDRFYRNITIEDNIIHNHHWHGITVGETDNLVIKNNTILPTINRRLLGKEFDKQMIPRIKVVKSSRNVSVVGNVTSGIAAPKDALVKKNYILAVDFTVREQLLKLFGRSEMLGALPDKAYITKHGEILEKEKIGSVLTREPSSNP